MDLGLRGRVAIVAAASKGLGLAVAEELAREGADMAICARTAADLEKAAARINGVSGREVYWRETDGGDGEAVARFVKAVEERFGRVDICVRNTGGPPSKLSAATTSEEWRAWIDQLLMSVVYFAQSVLPRMQKNRWGRFLTITSYSVKQPVEGLLLSNSLRAGVVGLCGARDYGKQYLPGLHAHGPSGRSCGNDGGARRDECGRDLCRVEKTGGTTRSLL
jgi:3-oxoacyl-[acyl-carrier protein] reductase